MKKFILLAALLCVSSSVYAQQPVKSETPPSSKDAPKVADWEERRVYATEFQKLRPIKSQVDATFYAFGEKMSPEGRAKFLEDMRVYFDYKSVEKAPIDSLMQVFSAKELKAMVDFYKSPEGKSAGEKMSSYEARVTPAIAKALDDALAKVKYGNQ